MRTIKDMLRLKWACGLSNRQVAASCGVARSTVAETLYRATAAGLSWPLPEDLDDAQLETRLYPTAECRFKILIPRYSFARQLLRLDNLLGKV
jgi:hypothetical protein